MNGRDKNGRFAEGNKLARNGGRKPRETERRFLDLLRGCVSENDAREIVKAAVEQAKRRDGQMERKWLFDYLAGPPVQRVAPTDPEGEREYSGGLDDERVEEIVAILEAARARADSAADEGGSAPV